MIEARFAPEPPTPTVLCALGITIAPEYRGRGLSRRMIERMAELGRVHGLDTSIAPVRPTLKHRYPLTPIERYLVAARPDGTHLDPWLRTHERLGAEIIKVASESVVITGTVADWEEWTEMAFPDSGAYVVSGALVPIEIDRERDEGVYIEPNVWMVHLAPAGHQTLSCSPHEYSRMSREPCAASAWRASDRRAHISDQRRP